MPHAMGTGIGGTDWTQDEWESYGDPFPDQGLVPEDQVDVFALQRANDRVFEAWADTRPNVYTFDGSTYVQGPVEVIPPVVEFPRDIFPETTVPPTFVNMRTQFATTITGMLMGALLGVTNIYLGNRWVIGYQMIAVGGLDSSKVMARHGKKARATRVNSRTLQGPGAGRRVIIRRKLGAVAPAAPKYEEEPGRDWYDPRGWF